MADQDTNVRYNAVSNFSSLHNDIDTLLAKIKALKDAEKDLQKETDKRNRKSTSGTSSKSSEANEARRIKRLDQAQKLQAQQANRIEKAKDQAAIRRARKSAAELKNQILQEARAERQKDAAQRRRSQKADAELKKRIAEEKAANDALNNDMVQRSRQFTKQRMREIDQEHAAKLSSIRDAFNEQKKLDKQRAQDLSREIAVAQSELGNANAFASRGNRFSRLTGQSVRTRDALPKHTPDFEFDSTSSKTYWQQLIAHREMELELTRRSTEAVKRETTERGKLFSMLSKISSQADKSGTSLSNAARRSNRDIRNTNTFLGNMMKNLDQIGRWRPRLLPPFIALIPIIGSLLALLNPLVAGLGAVGAAAFGLASSLGSLAGAALGAIPALASLLSLAGALKLAFGGVGNAFKTANKIGSGGGGGTPTKEELTQVEKIERAQEKYRRAIEDVQLATQDLDEAKKDYVKRLKEVEKQVNRVRTSEARAAANAQLAIEEYYNVMADPGSTKGQKMDAFVGMEEAQQDLEDVRKEAQELQKELDDMKKKGVNGDDAVRRASRALTDAIWAQRDAQLDLANAYKDTGKAAGGAAGAADKFAEAMDKLSPSAQAFVMALLAMKPAWEELQKSVQERFFSEIIGDVQSLTRLFPALNALLGNAAGAFGQVASEAIKMATSDKWLRDLGILSEQNIPLIKNVGEGILAIADAMMDLTIAAGPFAIAMSEGFKKGAKNFQTMLSGARESGSLAKWLETIQERMSQWWRIVKNVGKTLFNYGAAAAPFGQWLTDGLEDLTKGWLAASEASREAGSGFQQYLEDIKPLLSEVKNLFADFFRWFGREASNPDNINSFTEVIRTIREDLGPALGRIFDSLSETGVQQSLIDSIVDLAEAIADFLESGGAEGFKEFFEVLGSISRGASELVKALPDDLVSGLAKGMGAIAVLRFTGLTKLIGGLLSLAPWAGKLTGLFKQIGKSGTGSVGGAAAGGAAAGGAGSAKGAASGRGVLGSLKGVGGKLLPIIGKAGIVGAVVSAGVEIGSSVSSMFETLNNPEATDRDKSIAAFKASLTAGSPGWDMGASLIDLIFPGAKEEFDNFKTDIASGLYDFFTTTIPDVVSSAGDGIWGGIQGFGEWLGEQWSSAVSWFQDLPANIFQAAGYIWGELEGFGEWLAIKWEDAVVWFQNLPANVATVVSDIWTEIKTFPAWLGEQWANAVTWFQNLPQNVANTVRDMWANTKGFREWLTEQWSNVVSWFQNLPQNIANTARDIWGRLPTLYNWAVSMWNGAAAFFADIPRRVASTIGDMFRFVTKNFDVGYSASRVGRTYDRAYTGGVVSSRAVQRFYRGGQAAVVPGIRSNVDTVPAMLTPGEVIFSKMAVARAGGADNLLDFNAGKISFGEMMMNSAFSNVQGMYSGGIASISTPSLETTTGASAGTSTDNSITIERLEIVNPSTEPSEDSLANALRTVSHLR